MARALGKPDYSARCIPPTCHEFCAFAMADRKDAAADRPAFDKARADKKYQAQNGHDQSRGAKCQDVHEGHLELLEVHEGCSAHHPIRQFPNSHVFTTTSSGKNVCT
jgi:hypothetical protein